MQLRHLQIKDVGKPCAVYVSSISPEKNKDNLPAQLPAYVFHDGYLYFVDPDNTENKCIYIKLSSDQRTELKRALGINDDSLKKTDVLYKLLIAELSAEQLENMFLITEHSTFWLQKVIFLQNQINKFKQQSWDYEVKLSELEKQIAKLEAICPKKWEELEKVYPNKYKKTDVRPTDFEDIKLEELKKRIDNLESRHNKPALSNHSAEIKKIKEQYETETTGYLNILAQLKGWLSKFEKLSKGPLSEEKFRPILRAEVNKLPMEQRIEAVTQLAGPISLSVLVDIYKDLKNKYEKALHDAYFAATGVQLKGTTEDLFMKQYATKLKDHFKEFTKKPTEEMVSVKKEIHRIAREILQGPDVKNQSKYEESLYYLRTLIHLACSLETYRFTDEVQRLDVAEAVLNLIFTKDSVAGEFVFKLTGVQVQNSFAVMPHSASEITPLESEHHQLIEASLWLRGLHQLSYGRIAPYFKKEDGTLDPAVFTHLGDKDDREFFEHKTLVKWSLAQYYCELYKMLLRVLPASALTEEVKPLFPDDVIEKHKPKKQEKQTTTSTENPPATQDVVAITTTITTETVIASAAPASASASTGSGSETNSASSASNAIKSESGSNSRSSLFQSICILPLSKLEGIMKHDDVAKYTLLKNYLTKYQLTDDQNDMIEKDIKPLIEKLLQKYKNAWFSEGWMPTFIIPQKSIKEAKEGYKKIVKTHIQPKQYIIEFIEVAIAIKSNDSKHLWPKSLEILNNIFQILYSTSGPQNQPQENGLAASVQQTKPQC